MTLTTTQHSALGDLRERGSLRPSSRAFSRWNGQRTYSRRTLQALVDAGFAEWRTSVRGTRRGPVTFDGFVTPVTPVTITLRFNVDRALTADMIQALTDLSYVMQVQAEDGLYTTGLADQGDFLAHLAPVGAPQITLGA